MKALSMRISIGIIALGALFYFLACSPATQDNKVNQNQSVAQNQNAANASKDDLKPCEVGSAPGSHSQQIKKEIKDKMGPSLKKLLKDADNPNGTFTVEVQKAGDGSYFVAHIKGKVSGDDNLKELSNILNDFQSKEECLRVIYFLPGEATHADPGDGFEWSSCEHPMVVCPNGECCVPPPYPNGNTNGNANANSNTNRGGNSNN